MSTLPRVLTAAAFIPLLILLSRLGGVWFLVLVGAIQAVASWEFYHLMEAKGVNPSKKTGVFAVLVLCVMVYVSGTEYLGLFVATLVIAIMLRELFRAKIAFPIYDIATTVFGVLYIGWLASYLLLLRQWPGSAGLGDAAGSAVLLYVFLIAWGCDAGAFFLGSAFGRHKLFPRVSPKKSVQGAAAGFLVAVGMAFLGRAWFVRDAGGEALLTAGQTLSLGVLLGIATQLGDLVESLLKRDAHVKDASHMIPGHGGVLDIFDGLLFSAPVTYYFLTLVAFR